MKKGFTIIEVLAVIVIITLLTVLIVPNIINSVNNKRAEVSESSKKIIYDATDLYVKANRVSFPIADGATYCVKLETLVNNGNLVAPIKDLETDKEIPLNYFIKVTLDTYEQYSYELASECTPGGGVITDTTPPTVANVSLKNKTTNSITVIANGYDKESGISYYQFSKDNGTTWEPTTPQSSNEYTFSNLETATYQIKVRVINGTYDSKGLTNNNYKNSSTNEIATGVITVPIYTIDEEGWATSKTVTIIYPEGEGLTKQYSLDDGDNWETYTEPITFNENGTILARVTDGTNTVTGYISGSSYVVSGIDTTSPTVVLNGKVTSSTTTINIPITTYDSQSGVASTVCEYGTSTEYGNSIAGADDNCSITGLSQNTLYYYRIRVTDEVGNSSVNASSNKEVTGSFVTGITYSYTGNYQQFTTKKAGYYKIELWGAQGGSYTDKDGGKGAYTSGIINLNANETLWVYVGQQGPANDTVTNVGGWNGGGYSGNNSGSYSSGGGGATDIRLTNGTWDNEDSLKSRIMVAAGGGGNVSTTNHTTIPGYGGGLTGGDASGTYSNAVAPTGATQTSTGTGRSDTHLGSFGYGVQSNTSGWGGGGGSGYYGGVKGHGHAGSGGSSFISGHLGCRAITSASDLTPKSQTEPIYGTNNSLLVNSYHYSNRIFTSTEMRAGNEIMPTQNGLSTMIGNTGNGYAKITYCDNEISNCDDNTYLVNYSEINTDLIGDFTPYSNGKNSTNFYSVTATEDSGLVKRPTGDANRLSASYSDSLITITSNNAIDLTDYSKLVFVLRMYTNHSELINTTYVGLSNSLETSATTTFFRSSNVSTNSYNDQVSKVIEIDVSDINTSKYIKVATHHSDNVSAYTAVTFIDKIYLVK